MHQGKYVIIDVDGLEMPIACSELMQHYQLVSPNIDNVVGAGFFQVNNEGRYVCWGRSISLKVDSRGEKDEEVMNRLLGGYDVD